MRTTKLLGHLLMAIFICLVYSCQDNEPLPEPTPPVVQPEEPEGPEEPEVEKVYLGISPHIENMQEQRAVVESWKEGHCLGVTVTEDINVPFTFDGKQWKAGKEVEVTAEQKVSAYYPYNVQYTDIAAIPVDITTQEDYMYGEGGVSIEKPSAVLVMKHALSLIKVLIKKNDYIGDGMVDAVTFGGVQLSASMDVISGTLLPSGRSGEYKAGGNYILDDASPIYVEAILMPVSSAEGITVNVHMDGKDFTYSLPATHTWKPGMIYTYTLNMKSGYNCEVDVDHVPLDVEYWSTFGKTDQIVMRESGTDRIYIRPNYTEYGYDTYTGEGKVWGFFLRYRNRGGEEDFTGQARFVLMEGNRIVEQYQPFDIKCGNGVWDGYRKYCYVQAAPGTYRLAVLFRKNGESTWFKPYGYDQGSNDEEWMYEVKPATDIPALRMITLENQKCNTFLAYRVPNNDWFNIVYTLSNKSKKPIKGTIKVVWEREFKLESNSYRPSAKRDNTLDDEEWRDELGSCAVDIASGVRFWKGLVSCKFPIYRENPRDADSGVGYCTPMVHLYYQAEGTSEWKLLRCDAEYLFNRSYEGSEDAKIDEAFNYLGIIPQSW